MMESTCLIKAGCSTRSILEDASHGTKALLVITVSPEVVDLVCVDEIGIEMDTLISTPTMEFGRYVAHAVMTLVKFVYFAQDASRQVSSSRKSNTRSFAGAAVARASDIKPY